MLFLSTCVSMKGSSWEKISAEETGFVIMISYESEKGFNGSFEVSVLDSNNMNKLASQVFKPHKEGLLIIPLSRENAGKSIRIATRFIAPDGTQASLQPFNDIFRTKLGVVFMTNKKLKIYSYGGTELLPIYDKDMKPFFESQWNNLLAKDSDFGYFSPEKFVMGRIQQDKTSIDGKNLSYLTVTYTPMRSDNLSNLPESMNFSTYKKYLSYIKNPDDAIFFASLYKIVGDKVVERRDIFSLSTRDKIRMGDWLWQVSDSKNMDNYFEWYQLPLILNEEMYQLLSIAQKNKEQTDTFERFSQYALPYRNIYLYRGKRDPFIANKTLSNKDKAALADLFLMLPEKYRYRGAFFGKFVSGFSHYTNEDLNSFGNGIYKGILESLKTHSISRSKFFSYYTPVDNDITQKGYKGEIYNRHRRDFFLTVNIYNLNEEDRRILMAWKDQ